MDWSYVVKKIYNRIYINFLSRNKVYPNIYHLGNRKKTVNKVLFYFFDSRFMHFGDHLFFEPICRLMQEGGYEVAIIPVKAMEKYFIKCGYTIENKSRIKNYDLVISKPDFIWDVKKYENVLLIETAYANIKQPLIEDMFSKLKTYYNITANTVSRPLYISNETFDAKNLLDSKSKYIIFNNYVNSGSFRISKEKYVKLESFVREFLIRCPQYQVIHTGSKADKVNDHKRYDFVTVDLRGKTTPLDLFNLCALENVINYIGFDGYIMHLFFLQNKKCFVMSRGRWTKKERYFLENYIDPPYKVDDTSLIKEYIR